MGVINNLAGAAGALGLIALETAGGLGPIAANASLRPGALAIGLSGWLGFRSRRRPVPARAWIYGLLAVPGAAAGAWMAITLPVWVYRTALCTILIGVLMQQLRRRIPASGSERRDGRSHLWKATMFFLVGVHMGFIQVGTGLLSILVLSSIHDRDLVATNAAKMAVVILSSAAAVGCFAWTGKIIWLPSLALALGAALGSFLASRWSVDKGHEAVRNVVLVITFAVLARLGWQVATGS